MQIDDEDFPYSSDDPSLAPVEKSIHASGLTTQQLEDIKASLRLVVGSTLSGRDAYILRLRRIQAGQEAVLSNTVVANEEESSGDRLRYLLLGLLFETPDVIQRGLGSVENASSKTYCFVSKLLSPITDSRAFRPISSSFEKAAYRGEKMIDRLIMKGRIEEQNSRLLLRQQNIDDLVNDLLKYVILDTGAQEIIQETGMGMAGGVIDEFREQSAAVDTSLEQKLKSIFRKGAAPKPGDPPNHTAEEG